jgi:hypothetical protein
MASTTNAGEMPGLVTVDGRQGWLIDDRFVLRMAGGEDPAPGDPKPADPKPEGGDDFDKDRALATIRKLREGEKAAKATAKELEDARTKLREFEDKDKTDSEKLSGDLKSTTDKLTAAEQRAAQAETRYKDALIRSAIDREAHKGNAVDADAVAALIDRSGIDIDDAGTVTGADKAVAALLKAKPYLVGGSNGSGGAKSMPGTPNGAGDPSKDELVKQALEKQAATGLFGRM